MKNQKKNLNNLNYFKNNIRIVFSTILIGLVLLLWHYKVEPFHHFSLQFNDLKYSFNNKKPNKDVVFVAVDEKSVTQFGRWPWDRELLGEN